MLASSSKRFSVTIPTPLPTPLPTRYCLAVGPADVFIRKHGALCFFGVFLCFHGAVFFLCFRFSQPWLGQAAAAQWALGQALAAQWELRKVPAAKSADGSARPGRCHPCRERTEGAQIAGCAAVGCGGSVRTYSSRGLAGVALARRGVGVEAVAGSAVGLQVGAGSAV